MLKRHKIFDFQSFLFLNLQKWKTFTNGQNHEVGLGWEGGAPNKWNQTQLVLFNLEWRILEDFVI
jgi:hypothetical protein